MRKFLAGSLIRLAHRIYQPTVTGLANKFSEFIFIGADGSRQVLKAMPPERRVSRGWE